ncbi:hypothetical protein Tco_0056832, partial [Tanacetum coccineum]
LSSAALAVITARPACHPSLASCLSSHEESLPYVPNAYAVSDVHGVGTHVHIPAHGGSEAHNGPPGSILSHEPKPLGKHRSPPPQSVLSPDEISYPLKLCNPSIDLSYGHRCYLRNCLCRIHPSIPNTIPNLSNPPSSRFSVYGADKLIIDPLPPVGLAVELSPTSYLEPRANKHDLLRGGRSDSRISSLRSTGGGMYRDGGSGGSEGDGNAEVTASTRA